MSPFVGFFSCFSDLSVTRVGSRYIATVETECKEQLACSCIEANGQSSLCTPGLWEKQHFVTLGKMIGPIGVH